MIPDHFTSDEPTNNATEAEATRAIDWCLSHPLHQPTPLTPSQLHELDAGHLQLLYQPSFAGSVHDKRGAIRVESVPGSGDACLTSSLPLFVADAHHPVSLASGRRSIYYEVRVVAAPDHDVNVCLGYVAPPYPVFRLPGWHRGSLAVHGDDGHRYVNDMWGGKAFVRPFASTDTLGLGMTFTLPASARDATPGARAHPTAAQAADTALDVEVFFTRNGRLEAAWDVHEEADALEDLPVTGLEGAHDLFAAVGCFGTASFEVVFAREAWLFTPPA